MSNRAQGAVIINTESEPDAEREDERRKEEKENSQKSSDNEEDKSKNDREFLEDGENINNSVSEHDTIEQNEQ